MISALLVLILAQDPAQELQAIRDKVAPSVVALEVVRRSGEEADPEGITGSGAAGTHQDYYNRPLGPSTGTVYSADGYILTCAFNVSGDVIRITVITPDGKRHEAKRVGWDAKLDVALLKIEAGDLKPLAPAKLENAKQGDFVCVVGRAPDPASPTINLGIVSALNRLEGTAVQSDAEINYGNSGGPMVNLDGELIGIVSRIRPKTMWGQSGGVGFATKMSEIEKAIETLKKGQQGGDRKATGVSIGIIAAEPKEGQEGIVVDQILPNSPAEEAGLDQGDLITAVDGKKVKTLDGLKAELDGKAPGVARELTIKRLKTDNKTWEEKKIKIRPEKSPE